MTNIGAAFKALHTAPFVIPNPWDIGSARMMAALGFPALATTSAGMAFALGQQEGTIGREAVLDHCRALVAATPLPVSADLEMGFGHSPESAADTIRAAAAIGLAGCSLEDHTGDPDDPIYDFSLALSRIAAAAKARDALGYDFVLTARCENLLWGRPDLDAVIARLQAYEAAGADALYAPGLRSVQEITAVSTALNKPINVLAIPGLSLADMVAAGATRISLGSAPARLAYGAMITALQGITTHGDFAPLGDAIGFAELQKLLPKEE